MILDTEQKIIVANKLVEMGETIGAHPLRCGVCMFSEQKCGQMEELVSEFNKIARFMNENVVDSDHHVQELAYER